MEQIEQIKVLMHVIENYNATPDFEDIYNLAKKQLYEKISSL